MCNIVAADKDCEAIFKHVLERVFYIFYFSVVQRKKGRKTMTNIILVGCNGRMGQMINGIVAGDEDVAIVAGIDILDNRENGYPVYQEFSGVKEEADVIVDFSSANNLEKVVDFAIEKKVALVECSTGLSEEQTKYLLDAGEKTAFLRSANMSLGVNLLLKIVKEVAC